jgi:ribosomal-protein-alanine N-acetyltransferase
MSLVALGPAHVAVLAGMHRVCFAEPWDEAAMAALLAMPGAYGFLIEDGRPQGFILCRVAAGEVEVLTLLVLPPYRRQRLGVRLLDAALAASRRMGAETMFLEVAANNAAAQALYADYGFIRVGRRPRYYGGGIDALVLRLDL